MTQTQTTAERLLSIIGMNYTIIHDQRGIRVGDHSKAAQIIAVEIDTLTAQLAEARAEVERLRPAAEAWRTLEAFRSAENFGTLDDERAARKTHADARDAARAREAKGTQP